MAGELSEVRTISVDGSPSGADDLLDPAHAARCGRSPARRRRARACTPSPDAVPRRPDPRRRRRRGARPAGHVPRLRRLTRRRPQAAGAAGLSATARLCVRSAACATSSPTWCSAAAASAAAAPGRALCRGLRGRRCPTRPHPAWPTPTPGRAGAARGRRRRTTARCGRWSSPTRSAASSRSAGRSGGCSPARRPPLAAGPVVLVPVPVATRHGPRPRPRPDVRPDPRAPRRLLRGPGYAVDRGPAARLPRRRASTRPGSTPRRRASNLAGSMCCPSRAVRRLAGRRLRVVVCDDVLTTGATAREAQRALEAAGLEVAGIATVAATAATRRRAVSSHRDSSGLRLSSPGHSD